MCTTAAHAAPFARGCISLHTAPARDTASGTSMQFLAVRVPTLPTSRATRHGSTPSPRKLHWSCPGPSWHKVFLIHTCVHVHSHAGISRKGKVQGSSPSSIPDLLLPARPALDLAPADCFTDVCFASRWCCCGRRRRTRSRRARERMYGLLLPLACPLRALPRPPARLPARPDAHRLDAPRGLARAGHTCPSEANRRRTPPDPEAGSKIQPQRPQRHSLLPQGAMLRSATSQPYHNQEQLSTVAQQSSSCSSTAAAAQQPRRQACRTCSLRSARARRPSSSSGSPASAAAAWQSAAVESSFKQG